MKEKREKLQYIEKDMSQVQEAWISAAHAQEMEHQAYLDRLHKWMDLRWQYFGILQDLLCNGAHGGEHRGGSGGGGNVYVRTGESSGSSENGQFYISYLYERAENKYRKTIKAGDAQGEFTYRECGYTNPDGSEYAVFSNAKVEGVAEGNESEWLCGLQTALDTYGTIDQGIGGAFAGFLSAAIDLYNGNYFSAGMGVIAGIPIIGLFGDAYKMGRISRR